MTKQIDSLQVEEEVVPDTAPDRPEVIPATADESFADFFYNFASNERFQQSRIVFPISYYKGREVTRIAMDLPERPQGEALLFPAHQGELVSRSD